MLNQPWGMVTQDLGVHMHSEILEWLGYENQEVKDRKTMFINLLRSHKLAFRELKHTDSDFTKFPELVKEVSLLNKITLLA